MTTTFTRRDWLAAATLLTTAAFGKAQKPPYQYILANQSGATPLLPADRYIPFDWAFNEIPVQGEGPTLTWNPAGATKRSQATLRLTSATDVREDCLVGVKTAVSGKTIGVLTVRFAMYLQPFELPIPAADLPAVLAEGVTLTMQKGSKPFWFFTAGNGPQTAPDAYLPHLLLYEKTDAGAWKERLVSLASVQTFGWMEGCVLDGLHELSARSPRAKAVLAQHLDLFFGQNSLVYANLNNRKAVGIINTVESILPFAILAQTSPTHPLLQTAIRFCETHASADGVIADGTGSNRMVKTEECYTVSYPLAVLAKTLNRPDLAHLAAQTLQARVTLLDKGTRIFQRGAEQEAPVFENWSRGVAWYLLGLVKTLAHLPDNGQSAQIQSLKAALQNAVKNVIAYQQPNGLWYCFMHQPETGYETSGTAGIAAALVYGQERGLLPETVRAVAQKARRGLNAYLTPDGYLTGTAQGNKGGDALQRNGFRVISPYTLGFLAHLDSVKS
ncbi:MAG: glycoside hydrolase family 88 protein [Bacteroidetes bacterium]|nr:glycoside hydrolase family 88 protein [Fibrella sp.]